MKNAIVNLVLLLAGLIVLFLMNYHQMKDTYLTIVSGMMVGWGGANLVLDAVLRR